MDCQSLKIKTQSVVICVKVTGSEKVITSEQEKGSKNHDDWFSKAKHVHDLFYIPTSIAPTFVTICITAQRMEIWKHGWNIWSHVEWITLCFLDFLLLFWRILLCSSPLRTPGEKASIVYLRASNSPFAPWTEDNEVVLCILHNKLLLSCLLPLRNILFNRYST
jgi:hypothetical protein